MGYIGSKSAITKLSQLENDIGYKKCKGTVKEFMVSNGKFNGVTWLTDPKKEYPVFKVPRYTSEVNNDAGFGPGKFLDIKQNVLMYGPESSAEKIISTLDPNDSSISNIQVPTSETQLYNSAEYTKNIGTIQRIKVTVDNDHPTFPPFTSTGTIAADGKLTISFNITNDITKLTNNGDGSTNSKLLTPSEFNNYFKAFHLTTKDNTYLKFTNDVVTSVNFYFIRYGKIRILHGGVVRATVGGSSQKNNVLIATIKNDVDKPNTYSNPDLNHYHYVGYGSPVTQDYNTKGAISIDNSGTNIDMLCWNGGTKNTYDFYIHAEWLAR